jgi:hypothetical protein
MTFASRFIAPVCTAIALTWPVATATRAQQRPVFRSTAVGVAVDVSVKKGNTPVPNLTSADFALSDNGVPQTVESVQIETVPVDVTLAVDVSGSTRGLLGRYRSDVAAIAQLLRPVDRLRLIAFGSQVDEALRLGSIVGRAPVERLAASSNSAVYDGIAAALLRPTGFDRRHLIVAFTDSYDNRSVVSPELLAAAASRSESVLHIVSREPPSMGASDVIGNGLFWPPVRSTLSPKRRADSGTRRRRGSPSRVDRSFSISRRFSTTSVRAMCCGSCRQACPCRAGTNSPSFSDSRATTRFAPAADTWAANSACAL